MSGALLSSAALSAFLMGLAGSPHCVAMCGGPSHTLLQSPPGKGALASHLQFHLGRLLGYGILGAVVAGSFSAFSVLAASTPVLKPAWTLFHAAALMLGLALLIHGNQPQWVNQMAHRVWSTANRHAHLASGFNVINTSGLRPVTARARPAPILIGVTWALLPCGLLYSALLVAALSGEPVAGALLMAAFAAGTSVTLLGGSALLAAAGRSQRWIQTFKAINQDGRLGTRIAGAALAGISGWALIMLASGNTISGFCQ
jgi:uncharacterized protein